MAPVARDRSPMPTDVGDAALLARARAGSGDALAALYERHAGPLFRLAYRILGSAEDAEDVVQDLFVGLPELLQRYREQGSPAGWLRRVAARLALMRRRADVRRAAPRRGVDAPGPPNAAAGGDAGAIALRLALRDAVDALPEPLRVVFVLREVEGYTHAEIAETLGITQGASAVRLYRATRLLRRRLRDLL